MAERKQVLVPLKPISESKTVWMAALTILAGVLFWAGVLDPSQWGEDRIEGIVGTILTVVGAINAIIRIFFTTSPVLAGKSVPAAPEKDLK